MSPIPPAVKHVIGHLDRTYGEHVDLDDVTATNSHARSQYFRTRALTALAIQDLTGCGPEEASAGVIDGFDDQGIDGIAVAPDGRRVWIVQTKWSDQAKGSLDQGSALKLIRGIRKLQDGEYDDFGDNLLPLREDLDAALGTGGVRIVIVACVLGKQPLSPVIRGDLKKFVDESNSLVPTAELVVVGFDEVYEIVKRGVAEPRVDLSATLENWGQLPEPYLAYYGCMSAADVARWYSDAGEKLFDQNIRRSLGLTEVNQKIRTTLKDSPEAFWYLNNGITVLCESLSKTLKGSSRSVGTFDLIGASVVNGAQTVRSIFEVAHENPDTADDARVWVRLISLAGCPAGFAGVVTEATNTQNQVEARDFVSLDPVQAALRDDFAMTLQKSYVIKRGEPDPDRDAGCSVVEVARALACAQPDARFAARARQEGAVLWERGEKGTYEVLFGRSPGADRAWRLVTFMRAVADRLRAEEKQRDGRALRVAAQSEYLVAHVLLRHAVTESSREPSSTQWSALLDLVGPLVDLLVMTIDRLYTVHSVAQQVFRDPDSCVELAGIALDHLATGSKTPALPIEYQSATVRSRRQRKPNAVTVLIDASALPDGTELRFVPRSAAEDAAFAPWLTEDGRRGRATWVNNRSKPLLWEADGQRYSPSGLAMAMLGMVGLKVRAVQGPSFWHVPGTGSLVDLADVVREQGLDSQDSPSRGAP